MNKKLKVAREVVALSSSFGASMLIGNYLRFGVPSRKAKPMSWALTSLGKLGVEGLVAQAVYESTKVQFDGIIDAFNARADKIN